MKTPAHSIVLLAASEILQPPNLPFDAAASAKMERTVFDLGRTYHERNEALRELARAHHEELRRLARAARMLRWVVPMHDIGKLGVPDDLLKEPGDHSAEERRVIDSHPLMGAQILGRSRIPLFQLASEAALNHHERYRPAFDDATALQMLAEQRGLAFDPMLADLLLAKASEMIALRERINQDPPSFESLMDQG